MTKVVRLSRKEKKRNETSLEKQSRKKHKQASRSKTNTVRDWGHIFTKHGVPGPAELQSVIDKLIIEYRDGGVEPCDYAQRIFDPSLRYLTELPVGLLDHKEEALPRDMLPQGPGGKDELRALCERMIIRNRNEALIKLVVDGWPGTASWDQKLDGHVGDLWRLSQVDFDLYRSIVCGQHGEVLLRIKRKEVPTSLAEDFLIRMLVRHGLLWCTNDIQLILARNALADRNPFGMLVSSDYTRLEPTRIVNDLRGHFVLLRLVLDLYVTTAAAGDGKEEQDDVPDDPIAKLLKSRIEHHAKTNSIDLLALRPKLDVMIPHLEKILAKGGKRLRRELEKPVSANELEKHFHGIWFSGLSNVPASAVPLLRYLQAEAQLEQMIRDLIPVKSKKVEARLGTTLPAFSEDLLLDGWRTRAKELVYGYRRELLKDAGHPKDPDRTTGTENAGWAAIQKASGFLVDRGERRIEDCVGDENCPRRTYYLLDIIPEARLHRQFDMATAPHTEPLILHCDPLLA